MRYVMGIDGGGSKTTCLVANESGELMGFGSGGPVNTNYVERYQVIESIQSAISGCLQEAALENQQIETLSISAPIAPDILEQGTRSFNLKHILRVAEGETPRWAARFWTKERIGVTVDAGTGSLARGWTETGREAGAGAWGATLGDEGSGFWIGMQAMIAILQASDGRINPTLLTEPVLKHFNFSGVVDMVIQVSHGLVRPKDNNELGVVPDSGQEHADTIDDATGGIQYHKRNRNEPLTRYEVASLCPVIEKIALEGDKTAIEIFNKAGIELGRLAVAVIKRLEMEDERFAVIPFGGVFRANNLILDSFQKTILSTASKALVVKPQFEPVVGGVLLALNQIGVEINKKVIKTLEKSSSNFPACCVT
ncbi:MAG: BadF/BadG/BcrA/BcrD ATPase family protein [Anaerolineales bacterium]